jgi:DNA-binding MarR family transcriptional regulator
MRLMRIINKHSSLEEQPIRFNETVVLTPREIHSIQAIGEHDRINVKELGDHFGVSKSAASQMVAKLVEKGYVRKENPADNHKELQLSLTEIGWQAFRVHERFHGKHMEDLSKRLKSEFSDSEIARTSELLGIIEDVMNKRISELLDKE